MRRGQALAHESRTSTQFRELLGRLHGHLLVIWRLPSSEGRENRRSVPAAMESVVRYRSRRSSGTREARRSPPTFRRDTPHGARSSSCCRRSSPTRCHRDVRARSRRRSCSPASRVELACVVRLRAAGASARDPRTPLHTIAAAGPFAGTTDRTRRSGAACRTWRGRVRREPDTASAPSAAAAGRSASRRSSASSDRATRSPSIEGRCGRSTPSAVRRLSFARLG